jgi:hypothetical protein
VLVTAAPANTANDVAVPNPTGACTDAADATGAPTIPATRPMAVMVPTASTVLTLRRGLCPRATPVTDTTNFPRSTNTPDGRHAREQWDMPASSPGLPGLNERHSVRRCRSRLSRLYATNLGARVLIRVGE